MIGFDLGGNVMGGPGSLGDEGGSDSAGLYDPTKAATAATAEELYANRKAAMKAAGVTFGTKAYRDWDAKTRAAMGVKKGDKFSSGQWMETFGGMKPGEINEAAEGNKAYYLDDDLSVGMNKFTQDVASILGGISTPLTGSNKYGINLGNIPRTSVRSLNPKDINSPYPYEKVGNPALEAMRTLTQNKAANQAAMQSGIAYPAGTGGISLLEAAGYKYGTAGIAPFRLDQTPGAGAYFSPYYDEIVMSKQSLKSEDAAKKTRHELMHRLVNNMKQSGALSEIAVPQLEEIFDKFDVAYKGTTPTAKDFMNFVSLESNRNLMRAGMITRSPLEEWDEESQSYVRAKKGGFSMDFDPRMRTAGWEPRWGLTESGQALYDTRTTNPSDAPYTTGSSVTPWAGSSKQGKGAWDAWVAFQRELPSEKMGGAVAGATDKWGDYQTGPWGPATVSYSYEYDPVSDSYVKTPVSTGSQAPRRHETLPNIYQQVGLGNWPMGDEHALVAAQTARYPNLPGQSDYYGDMARFNRKAALVAHPDSRLRAIHDANLPDIVLDKMQDYLMETGLMWNQDMTYTSAMDYLSGMLSQYEMDKIKAIVEQGD